MERLGMKGSAFNSVFSRIGENGEQEHVMFNSLTGALAHLNDEGVAALKGADGSDAVLCEELAEAGFLVPDDWDERAWLEERFMDDMNATDFLSLCIAPTMECNLRCPYCYEQHEQVRMAPEVEDAICAFVEKRHAWNPVRSLAVLWYGGEPTLEVDVIERLGDRLRRWATDNGIRFDSMMISNASLVDDRMASRIAGAGISNVMPTFDGCAGCHDSRRVCKDGGGSFDDTLTGARALANAGVHVGASCNLDGSNIDDFRKLRDLFAEEDGIDINAGHLRNYGGWHERLGMDTGDYELLSRKEFGDALFDLYLETNPSAAGIYESLKSRRMFCQGKMASYFNIDPEGNVCRCDGDMRNPDKVLFNLLGEYELDWPETHSFFEKNPRCRRCAISPTCLGQCDWEWGMFGENCSPLKYTLYRYVWLLHDKLLEGSGGSDSLPGVCILVPPRDVEAQYAKPFSPVDEQGLM